jgi:hypothetical protein
MNIVHDAAGSGFRWLPCTLVGTIVVGTLPVRSDVWRLYRSTGAVTVSPRLFCILEAAGSQLGRTTGCRLCRTGRHLPLFNPQIWHKWRGTSTLKIILDQFLSRPFSWTPRQTTQLLTKRLRCIRRQERDGERRDADPLDACGPYVDVKEILRCRATRRRTTPHDTARHEAEPL